MQKMKHNSFTSFDSKHVILKSHTVGSELVSLSWKLALIPFHTLLLSTLVQNAIVTRSYAIHHHIHVFRYQSCLLLLPPFHDAVPSFDIFVRQTQYRNRY